MRHIFNKLGKNNIRTYMESCLTNINDSTLNPKLRTFKLFKDTNLKIILQPQET